MPILWLPQYVVRAVDANSKDIIFYIKRWSGCLTYDPQIYVESFAEMDGLRQYLEGGRKGADRVLTALFEKGG